MYFFFSVHCIKRLDSMLPWVCSVIDHGSRQTVDKKIICGKDISDTLALFSPHFEVICDLLLNRRTATWNLSVKRIFYSPGLW